MRIENLLGVVAQIREALHTLVDERRGQEDKGITQVRRSLPASPHPLGISWSLNPMTGWGVYGLNLTLQLQLQLQFNFEVLSLVPTETSSLLDLLHKALLHPVFSNQHKFQEILATNPGKSINCNFPVLHSLGNNFVTKEVAKGSLNVGIIFFEDTHLTPQALDKAKNYDVIVAGSNWNAEVLKGYGLSDVRMVRQGIDPTIFHAAAKSNLLEASAIASPTDKIRRAWLTFQLHSQERSGAVRCS